MKADKPIILEADPAYRRKMVLALIVLAVLCGAALILTKSVLDGIEALAAVDPNAAIQKIKGLIVGIIAINAVLSSVFGLYFVLLAIRVFRSDQFPPPGMKVVRDTVLRTGKKARTAGVILSGAAVLVLSTNLIVIYLYILVDNLSR
jgi:hypothetical protein